MRNFNVENNDINTNLVYQLQQEEKLDMVALEMIQRNKIQGLLDMVYTQNNSDKLLKYNITSKITLEQILERSINKQTIVKCFINIINTIILAEDYMLEQNAFLMESSKIYVNIGTYDIGLIYLPLKNNNKEVSLEMFFKNIIFTSKFDQSENCEYVAKIISYLNAPVFSLNNFKTFLYELIGENQRENINTQKEIHNVEMYNTEMQKDKEKEVKTIVDVFSDSKNSVNPVNVKAVEQINNTKSSLDIPGSTVKSMIPPMQNGGNIPQISVTGNNQQKNVKSSKKGGLFGGFGKKNKEQKKAPVQNDNVQIRIPDIPNNSIQNNSIQNNSVQNNNMPDRSLPNDRLSTNNSINVQTDIVQTNRMSGFGETTVLNQRNTGETTILSSNMQNSIQSSDNKKAYLIRQKNGERIFIDKEIFRIGKEKSYVDYFISDNTAISRSHANITKKDDRFYVKDTNSKNHTYVNGKIILPDTEVNLESGYKICLADEEFTFQIE